MSKKYPYQRATKAQQKIGTLWCWLHHEQPLEILTEPPEVRADYIRAHKLTHEIATRLRAMRPFTGVLPAPVRRAYAARAQAYAALAKAGAALAKAYAALAQAGAAWAEADAALAKALVDHAPAVEAAVRACCSDVEWNARGLVFPAPGEKKDVYGDHYPRHASPCRSLRRCAS